MAEARTYEALLADLEKLEQENARSNRLIDRLKESEDRYHRMLENLKGEFLFFRHDTQGRFTYISPSYANILGYEYEEYIGLACEDLWTPNPINEEASRRTQMSIKGYRQPPYEIEIYHKSGASRRFVVIETPVFDNQGRVVAVEGSCRDITQKRKTEEQLEKYRKHLEDLVAERTHALQTSQRQLLDIIDFLPDPTYVVDPNEAIVAWNRAMVAMTGIEEKAVIGMNFRKHIIPLYNSFDTLPIESVLCDRPHMNGEHQPAKPLFEERFLAGLHRGKGGYVWITTAPILDSENQIAGAIESIRDVTQIKSAERKVRESERRLSTLLSHLPGMAYRIVGEGSAMRVEFVSEGCRDIFGYEPSFFVGRDLLEFKRLIHPDDMNRMLETVRNAIAERKPFACEYRILTASDETKWVFDKAEPVFGEADETVALEGFMADFTVYKNLEHNLRDENLLLRSTIKDRYKFKNIIGNCRAMQDVFELILKAATTDDNVIIHGESGTGKELVAQAIHDASSRKNNSFVAVSCAAIPESLIESEFFGMSKGAFTGAYADKKGYLEASGNGSLFLDEIGEISLSMQAKLLRAIDGGGFSPVGSTRVIRPNLRIIAASNKNLEALVGSGDMRQDFYFRVNVIPIHLPPLRERGTIS